MKISYFFQKMLFFFLAFFMAYLPSQAQNRRNPAPPAWVKNQVIYEVNVRQFTPEGNLKALEAHLPRLKDLGVGILWLMPIHPISTENRKGSLGSYYAANDYTAVNPEFGTMDEFKDFVKKAHELGMYVILDWVANHTGCGSVWSKENPEWFKRSAEGKFISPYDWTDVYALNYNNTAMRNAMIEAMEFWVREADIDGYRCDVAGEVPTDFWNQARAALDKIKPVFMLAEAEKPELHEKAFDMSYGWTLHALMNKVAQGKAKVEDLDKYFAQEMNTYLPDDYRMQFTSNHDENSWNGTEFERLGKAVKTFAVFSFVIPSMPLIYNGQEVSLEKRLKFFDKDEIDWKKQSEMTAFYQKLTKLRRENPVIWGGAEGGKFERIKTNKDKTVFALTRQHGDKKLVAVFNFSDKPVQMQFKNTNLKGEMTDFFENGKTDFSKKQKINLEAWGFKVWTN